MFQFSHSIGAQNEARKQFVVDDGGGCESVAKKQIQSTKKCEDRCFVTLSSTPAGTTIGLKDNECGQMGVTIIAGTLGWIIDAPAATA